MQAWTQWIERHAAVLGWLAVLSAVMFVGTLLVVPWIVVRIPHDYFAHDHRPPATWMPDFLPYRLAALVLKNVLGGVLIAAGMVMLVLPGQGVLTMVAGVLLLDFPGKYRFERWLISWGPVLHAINWLRHRGGHEPLVVHE